MTDKSHARDYWNGSRRHVNPGSGPSALIPGAREETVQLRVLLDRICQDRAAGLAARSSTELAGALSSADPADAIETVAALTSANAELADLIWLRAQFADVTYSELGRRLGVTSTGARQRIERAACRVTLDEAKPLEAALKVFLDRYEPTMERDISTGIGD